MMSQGSQGVQESGASEATGDKTSGSDLASLSTTDLRGAYTGSSAATVLLLPFGATEQHGDHLPVGTDTLLAEALSQRVAEQATSQGKRVLCLPSVGYGCSTEHAGWPGTLSLRAETAIALLEDIGRSLPSAVPNCRLLVINGHGGNRSVLDVALRRLRRDHGLLGASFSFGDAVLDLNPPLLEVDRIHGGRFEASMLLALGRDVLSGASAHDSVRPMRLELASLEALGPGKPGKLAWLAEDLSVVGTLHGPTPPSREEGMVIFNQLEDLLARLIDELAGYMPPHVSS